MHSLCGLDTGGRGGRGGGVKRQVRGQWGREELKRLEADDNRQRRGVSVDVVVSCDFIFIIVVVGFVMRV